MTKKIITSVVALTAAAALLAPIAAFARGYGGQHSAAACNGINQQSQAYSSNANTGLYHSGYENAVYYCD